MLVPIHQLDDQSKIWIYQSTTMLSDDQSTALRKELLSFLEEWTSHNVQLHTSGDIFYNRFIVMMVDERYNATGGCSIDKSIHFIEYLEQKYGISLLDRMHFSYIPDPDTFEIYSASLHDLDNLFNSGKIKADTIVFNNLVKSKAEFESRWQIPLNQSWHIRFLKSSVV